ncbi:MAG: hypothetical protein R2777_07490 [Chitinophagales bacterium]
MCSLFRLNQHKNEAKVIMKREFPLDGTYELVIRSNTKQETIEGTDNRLIDLVYYDYKISFEVRKPIQNF